MLFGIENSIITIILFENCSNFNYYYYEGDLYMKVYQCMVGILGVVLMFIQMVWNKVDSTILILYFLLTIPVIAQYLSKAKIPGAEFEFKKDISKTEELVKISIDKANEEAVYDIDESKYYNVFELSMTKELLKSDPVLAIASLRIEIEKKLKSTIKFLNLNVKDNASLNLVIEELLNKGILNNEQVSALKIIIKMCNKVIHGYSISREDAERIVKLTDELNNTFSIGYSIDFMPNKNYKEQNLLCEWEHCIEHMGFTDQSKGISCPVFGHDCPGGKDKVKECKENLKIPHRT